MKMPWLFAFLLLVVSFGAPNAEAAYHYVRAGATGAQNGTDWNNAYPSLPASLVRGDTYYVAAGNYGRYVFNTPASGSTLITIKKATAADHGTDIGWEDAFGSGQAVFGQLEFDTPYWLVDGQTGGGPGSWKTGFGFKVFWSDATALIWLPQIDNSTPSAASNVTIRHIELQGTLNSSGGGSLAQDGVDVWGADAFTISYFYTHALGSCPFMLSPGKGFIAEYGYIADFVSTPAAHAEIASIWAFAKSFPTSTTIFRYNVFGYLQGTGGLIWDNSSNHDARLDIYGNVFWKDPSLAGYDNSANGVIDGWTGGNEEDFYNVHVYNNSFINIPGIADVLGAFPVRSGNNEVHNNFFYGDQRPGGDSSVWQSVTDNTFTSTPPIGTNPIAGSDKDVQSVCQFFDALKICPSSGGTSLAPPTGLTVR